MSDIDRKYLVRKWDYAKDGDGWVIVPESEDGTRDDVSVRLASTNSLKVVTMICSAHNYTMKYNPRILSPQLEDEDG